MPDVTVELNLKPVQDLLATHLDLCVGLYILQLKQRGGPSQLDFDQMPDIGQLLAEKGDQLLFKGKETARVVDRVAYGIAVLSFCPGGITLFGRHWESNI